MSALKGRLAVLIIGTSLAALLSACAAPAPVVSHANPQLTPIPAAARILGLNELTGLRPSDVVAILGQPDLQRDEPPAELWQYRAPDCILNLFFYRERDGYRLSRAETWQRDLANSAAPTRCHDENAPVRARIDTAPAL
jgi:hypothetical protein